MRRVRYELYFLQLFAFRGLFLVVVVVVVFWQATDYVKSLDGAHLFNKICKAGKATKSLSALLMRAMEKWTRKCVSERVCVGGEERRGGFIPA